jgi:hypothetical protein
MEFPDFFVRGLNPLFADGDEGVAPNGVDVASSTHEFEARMPPSAWFPSNKRGPRKRTGNKLLWGVCLFARERIWRATYYRVLEELVILVQPLALASFLETLSTQYITTSPMPAVFIAVCMFLLHVARCVLRHQFEIEMQYVGLQANSAVLDIAYRKVQRLNLSANTLHRASPLLQLLMPDAQQFVEGLCHFHNAWAVPMRVAGSIMLLFMLLGMQPPPPSPPPTNIRDRMIAEC